MTVLPMISRRLGKSVLPAFALTLGVSIAAGPMTAMAQVINDPAETMMPLMMSRPALPPKPGEEPQSAPAKSQPADAAGTPSTTSGATIPAKDAVSPDPQAEASSETTPQLDQDDPAAAAGEPSSGEPVKAKAVMVDINSNTLQYDKDRDVYVATGAVHMVISEQNSELHSDKMTYDQNNNLVIAEGNVVIIKNGERTNGSYAKIDLSRKSALINDYRTSVEKVRIKAQNAFLDSKYVQYENGRIVISPEMMMGAMGKLKGTRPGQRNQNPGKDDDANEKVADNGKSKTGGKKPSFSTVSPGQSVGTMQSDDDLSRFATGNTVELQDLPNMNPIDPLESDDLDGDGKRDKLTIHANRIDVHRDEYGYNKIAVKWPSLSYSGHKILTMPSAEFSYDEPSGTMEYLGPDIGYDPDYGGLFLGPGWDFKAGKHGSIRMSPLLTYGGGGRRSRGGARINDTGVGPGIGGVIHYRDPKTMIDAGYNTRVGQPTILAERRFFDGKTRLLGSVNEDYNSGFLGYERPGFGVMLADTRQIKQWNKFDLSGYSSIGFFKDEFFPNYDDDYFVDPKSDKPQTGGRIQLQAEFKNTKPLLKVGNFMDFGIRANVGVSGYTSGDFATLLRAGPTMNLRLGSRYQSSMVYYTAASMGDTPFVFDSYYRGRQNIIWSQAFKVNDYLTLGLRSNVSPLRDNAKDSLFTGNAIYVLVGPKNVKLNLAYDVIRKRSYFGLNFMPGQGGQAINYDTMRIFQPNVYDSAGPMP